MVWQTHVYLHNDRKRETEMVLEKPEWSRYSEIIHILNMLQLLVDEIHLIQIMCLLNQWPQGHVNTNEKIFNIRLF